MKTETENNNADIQSICHGLSFLLACAVQQRWSHVKFAGGQLTDNGFHYDFDLGADSISTNDFDELTAVMQRELNRLIERKDITVSSYAGDFLEPDKQPYLAQLYTDQGTLIMHPDFDGTMIIPSKQLGADASFLQQPYPAYFKILSVGGAYWQNQADQAQLQRVHVAVFQQAGDLQAFLAQQEQQASQTHRHLGQEQELFMFSNLVGSGLPLWLENGAIIRRQLENFIVEEEIRRGYTHVYTPDIAQLDLYEKSGHYPYYKDSMYAPLTIDGKQFMLRPMTCPHHFQIYNRRPHSFRELPVRLAELAKLYRYEKSGELSGLMRVRSFTLADAHIICRPNQVETEIENVLQLIEEVATIFGLTKDQDYSYRLSLGKQGSDKYFQDEQAWQRAESVLTSVLQQRGDQFVTADDEAAFYGPKIDVQMRNRAGKEETAFTVQYDFVMPQRFQMNYLDSQNQLQPVVVIHRSSIGAIERLIAFLIEFYQGVFPLWLSPCQLKILTVSNQDDIQQLAQQLQQQALAQKIRVRLDDSADTIGKKIRQSHLEAIPYVLVLGSQEVESQKFTPKIRTDLVAATSLSTEQSYSFKHILEQLQTAVDCKK